MNPIARFERACARIVEDTFARVFPSDLEPAQVGRKLVAVMQATAGDLYVIRVHPSDYARFAADRGFLEARWAALLREALPSERRGEIPRVLLHEDARVVAGSVGIETVRDERPPAYVLETPDGQRFAVHDGLRLGRSPENDVVLADARVSRRHARLVSDGDGFAVEDLGSANGTFVDGRHGVRQRVTTGSVITLGDTHLRVAGDAG